MTLTAMFTSWVLTACLSLIQSAPPEPVQANIDVLQIAKGLGDTTYRDFRYGSKGDERIDCVQFVIAVVERLGQQQQRPIDPALTAAIAIALDEDAKRALQAMVEKNDDRITGVQAALVKAGLGVKIAPAEAEPGDFVQYWYKFDGKWVGHAGVIESIRNGRATIYGSHRTTLQRERDLPAAERAGGVGSGPVFSLTDKARKVFVVRWTGPAAPPIEALP